jgi:hypothetical protein
LAAVGPKTATSVDALRSSAATRLTT